MLRVFKNVGDLFVSIILVVGFYLIFDSGNSDVTRWDIEEWIMFLSMIWVFVRFTLGLLIELVRTIVKDAMKEITIK